MGVAFLRDYRYNPQSVPDVPGLSVLDQGPLEALGPPPRSAVMIVLSSILNPGTSLKP